MIRETLQNGKYEIISIISRGGFGITYKAIDKRNNAVVCVKEFFIDSLCTFNSVTGSVEVISTDNIRIFDQFKTRFIKEAEILEQLDCKNIIKVYDVFEENDTAYYTMEYIDGKPLSEIIPENGFDESTTMVIMSQLLDAIQYIHDRKITHLDIKPSNILIRNNHEIILIDFGGSKRYTENGEQTSTSPLSKSEGFAPIELYRSHSLKEFSPATDIYEIGATLYNLITGKIPPSASEIMDEGNPIDNWNIPQYIKNAIRLAMEPGLKNRINSVAQLSKSLRGDSDDTVIEDDTVVEDDTIYDISKELDSPDNIKRGFSLRGYLTIGILAVLASVGAYFFMLRNTEEPEPEEPIISIVENPGNSTMEELQKFVERENSKRQKSYSGISIDSITLSPDGLEYHVGIDSDGKIIYDELIDKEAYRKDIVIAALRNDKALLEVCKKLIDLDLSLIWNYRYKGNNDVITIRLSSDELKTIKGYEGSPKERKLQQFSEMARNISRQCPQAVEDGLILVDCTFKDNLITYNYHCDSQYFNFIKSNLSEWKSDMEEQFQTQEAMRILINTCADNGVNINYIFANETNGKSITITYNTLTKKFL